MSDIGDAIGTAAEGGLYSRAVSNKDGEVSLTEGGLHKGHFAEAACLNCETPLTGDYCHNCGQKAHLHRTIRAFMHDVSHGALHFDSKTWRTLPKLVLKPGELTRRYIEGERAHFVSPMALFLFSIFLMFATFQLAGISAPTDLSTGNGKSFREMAADQAEELEADIAKLDDRLADADMDAEDRERLQSRREEYARELAGVRQAQAQVPFLRDSEEEDETPADDATPAEGESADDAAESTKIPLETSAGGNWTLDLGSENLLGKGIKKWEENPSLMVYKLQTNFYKFSWLLIPLSIPFVWLLFAWKRQFRAYDHAIFVTYSLGFMTLLILAIVLLGLAGLPAVAIVLSTLLIPPIHMYKQLRGAYGLSRWSALWRLVFLLVFIFVILTLFLHLLLVLGAF